MTNTTSVKLVEQPVFIKKKHELAKLFKELERNSADAVALIVDSMNADEAKVPLKLKLECARALIDMQIKVSDTISKDSLTRQIAEIKVNGLSRGLGADGDEPKRLPPRVDFGTIQEVE